MADLLLNIKAIAKDTSTARSIVVEDIDSLIKEEVDTFNSLKGHCNKAVEDYYLGRIGMLEDLKARKK